VRVLIVSQVFAPEMGAASNRMRSFVRGLVAAGHEVLVATGMPNYPAGVVFPEYAGKQTSREEREGATVFRTACYTVPRNQSRWGQLRSYLSFIPAAIRSGLRAGKVDVVLVTSPPLFPAVAGIALARWSRARLALDIRDLWPDEIIACGAAREGSSPVRAVRSIERWAYRTADLVCCTTPSFLETVVARGVPRERAMLLPNGADLDLFRPLPPDNPVSAPYGFGDDFVVMYSGLFGIKHGLEVLLEAAHLLRHERRIRFALMGNGPRRAALQERAGEMGLENVVWCGEQEIRDIPYLLARADVCVSALLPEPYLEKIISVKLFEYLACEKPVVAAQSGESAHILEESGGGIAVAPGDGRALAEAILGLYRDPERRRKMAAAGREYVEAHYSRAVWADRLAQALAALPAQRARPGKKRWALREGVQAFRR
jgi:putative colanic acid biosynthesis glycosyltransferase WcaI